MTLSNLTLKFIICKKIMLETIMLNEMRTFILFAEEGSVQKVARRLPLTQPAVSRQIQRLEEAVGTSLLDRRQKPPVLTPTGREVLTRCREILASYASMKELAVAPEPAGVLRLGLANGLAHDSLAEAICEAIAAFPKVTLRLKSGWSASLAEEHRLGVLDAAIVLSDGPPVYAAEVLGTERLAVISGTAIRHTSAAIMTAPWVLSPEPCDARRLLTQVLSRDGRIPVVAAEIENGGLQLALVRKGLGLGLMPERLLRQAKPTGIVPIATPGISLCLDVALLRSPHLGALATVVDALARVTRQALDHRSDIQAA
ncbi:LysR family transcriptional regulator (plasmid) [Azospirillum oryzae]|uniref:LysR family transcriptional regulator n=1 Tax=Azospirillum oryzae TaxID=286727 RepID=A0A6N1ATJ6_9PROT|nr:MULTISPECIES: LysR family transcriptional regulator [Azospirillum]KAA0584738.1 LysR family transcriptional regulator [Azospirillum oryzae]QCG99232.1 LysR family transcriptional regulator [Azospirillum sp. TSA2s]QKS54689.1 LysR family transcriptional regulator [Azospirillum oryzae]